MSKRTFYNIIKNIFYVHTKIYFLRTKYITYIYAYELVCICVKLNIYNTYVGGEII